MNTTSRTASQWLAVSPVRRSAGLVITCVLILSVAFSLRSSNAIGPWMVVAASLAGAMLVLGLPVLVWSVVESLVRRHRRRTSPPLHELGLSIRLENILRKAGYETIRDVERLGIADLMLLPRVEFDEAKQFERALTLYRYRRWQEAGFPADLRP